MSSYNLVKGVKFDSKLKSIRPEYAQLLYDMGVRSMDAQTSIDIRGHSYEMAGVMAALGRDGTYTGMANEVGDKIHFENVLDEDIKRRAYPTLQTADTIPSVYK